MSAFAGFDDRMTAEERTLLRDLEEEEARAGHSRTHHSRSLTHRLIHHAHKLSRTQSLVHRLVHSH